MQIVDCTLIICDLFHFTYLPFKSDFRVISLYNYNNIGDVTLQSLLLYLCRYNVFKSTLLILHGIDRGKTK